MSSQPTPRVRVRPEVLALPVYKAGQSAPNAAKLSSNENPTPPPAAAIDAAAAAAGKANRYPDIANTTLREALAAHFASEWPDMTADHVVVSTGSSAILVAALAAVALPGSEVVYPWRSFESYPIAVPMVASTPVPVALTSQGRLDLDAMVGAISDRTSAVIVCTPNNPTGPALTFSQVKAFVEQVSPNVLILIDEAYIELATSADVSTSIPLIAAHPNVVVLRTFSKAYALAGMRVGYGIGHPELVATISKLCIPFGTSVTAQAAALAVLNDPEFVRASVQNMVSERSRVTKALRDLGYQVPDTDANFYFIPAQQSGPVWVQACADAGLIVRPFPEGVRISVGTPAENDRLLEVARTMASS